MVAGNTLKPVLCLCANAKEDPAAAAAVLDALSLGTLDSVDALKQLFQQVRTLHKNTPRSFLKFVSAVMYCTGTETSPHCACS